MNELQPGMLALVIGCRKNPDNIGRIVELVLLMNPGDEHDGKRFGGPEQAWKIKADGLTMMNIAGETYESETSYAAPRHLLPIKPETDPLHEKQQQELHA